MHKVIINEEKEMNEVFVATKSSWKDCGYSAKKRVSLDNQPSFERLDNSTFIILFPNEENDLWTMEFNGAFEK